MPNSFVSDRMLTPGEWGDCIGASDEFIPDTIMATWVSEFVSVRMRMKRLLKSKHVKLGEYRPQHRVAFNLACQTTWPAIPPRATPSLRTQIDADALVDETQRIGLAEIQPIAHHASALHLVVKISPMRIAHCSDATFERIA